MQTTIVGRPVSELDTPALLIDLDAFERNLAWMSGEIAAAGVAWRPHAKGHKCPAIAHKEIAAGAIGVTCAKLGEAEVMAANGVRDILVANQVVGTDQGAAAGRGLRPRRRHRRRRQHREREGTLGGCLRARDAAASDRRAQCAGWTARACSPANRPSRSRRKSPRSKAFGYVGLMGYEGHGMEVADPAARAETIASAVRALVETAEACRDAGLPVEIVSASGTGTYRSAVSIKGVTEVQAGGGTLRRRGLPRSRRPRRSGADPADAGRQPAGTEPNHRRRRSQDDRSQRANAEGARARRRRLRRLFRRTWPLHPRPRNGAPPHRRSTRTRNRLPRPDDASARGALRRAEWHRRDGLAGGGAGAAAVTILDC